MDSNAIGKIVELSKYEILDSDDVKFHVNHAGSRLFKYPETETFECFSITQLMNFLEVVKVEGKICINVAGHDKVQLVLPALNKNKKWDIVAESDFSNMIEEFSNGNYKTQEKFIIELMTKFERDAELEKLLSLVSNVKSENIHTSDDDGYSQVVAMKSGVHMAKQETIKNVWNLKTYKTFPEVDQPVIKYVLRLTQRSEENPKFALYDYGGGQWRVSATVTLRAWIQDYLKSNGFLDKVTIL